MYLDFLSYPSVRFDLNYNPNAEIEDEKSIELKALYLIFIFLLVGLILAIIIFAYEKVISFNHKTTRVVTFKE